MTPWTPKLAVTRCFPCGKWAYSTRKDARKVAHQGHPGEHMDTYRCPVNNLHWHYGHMHHAVLEGRSFIDRRAT